VPNECVLVAPSSSSLNKPTFKTQGYVILDGLQELFPQITLNCLGLVTGARPVDGPSNQARDSDRPAPHGCRDVSVGGLQATESGSKSAHCATLARLEPSRDE
jgi:uncharacterized Zn-binding protein involved in type VI secretion